MFAAAPGAARLYTGLRFTSWRFLAGPSHNGGMRTIIAALAALGGGVILAACAVSVATGDGSEVDWLVVGPLPFLVIGLVGFLRQPENRVVWWLVGVGVAFGCDVALGDVFLPMAENHWGVTSSITAAIALLDHWFAVAGGRPLACSACSRPGGQNAFTNASLSGRWRWRVSCSRCSRRSARPASRRPEDPLTACRRSCTAPCSCPPWRRWAEPPRRCTAPFRSGR